MSDAYAFDQAWAAERSRLAGLEATLDPGTRAHLTRLGARPGARCLEVGAGGGTVAFWLAEQVAPGGHVVATDVDTGFLQYQASSHPAVEIRKHDLMAEDLPGGFDLVSARWFVHWMPDKPQALKRLVGALRPGGALLVEEPDFVTIFQAAEPAALRRATIAMIDCLEASFPLDGQYGRRLLDDLRNAGLCDVAAEGRCLVVHGGSPAAPGSDHAASGGAREAHVTEADNRNARLRGVQKPRRRNMQSTYLTVAIPYVNAEPHLGYAYELVLADIHARARRLDGVPTRFLGGTDDNSLKNVLAAEAAGVPTGAFVNALAARFAALAGPLHLSFDDFICTSSDPRHIPAVHRLWNAALANGDLYKQAYEGDYCVGCERFYTGDELVAAGCPEHRRPLERVAEENWFFRLSRYQSLLQELIGSDRLRVSPEPFKNEVLALIRSGLEDISVSRSTARARGWGVPVPGDATQVVYVWFDALANYISALDFGDPESERYRRWWVDSAERTHVIGKGTVRFHAVYWPAFLASAGQPQPTHIRVHPYLTIGHIKLSKSSGTTIDPVSVISAYGSDALRWWFARDVREVGDTDFTEERLIARANADLAGGIGNAINRVATLVHRYRERLTPESGQSRQASVGGAAGLVERVRAHIGDFELRRATREVVDAVDAVNEDLERTQPWMIARDPTRAGELNEVLSRQLGSARAIARAIAPITPGLAVRAITQLERLDQPSPPAPLLPRMVANAALRTVYEP